MSGRWDLLFVYGSLMRGQSADHYLAHLAAAPATCKGRLYRVPAGYPALVADPAGREIQGEAVRFSEPGLLTLVDLYENTREGVYRRERLPIEVRGRTLEAWVYTTTARQAQRHGFHALDATDWRAVAPRRHR